MDEELKRNYPLGALDAIVVGTIINDDTVKLGSRWEKELKKKNLWLQVINQKGKVIASTNAPSQLPKQYTVNEILQIEESKQYKGYFIYSQLDTTYDKPYLFILGFENHYLNMLQKWSISIGENDLNNESDVAALEKELTAINGSIHVLNGDGKVLQTYGIEPKTEHFDPLDVLIRRQVPGQYDSDSTIYHDKASGNTWILQTPKKGEHFENSSMVVKIGKTLLIFAIAFFMITIGISIWHGFRYGQPLLLFTGWLERMGQGLYHEVLTEKERKKVFRKNGKVRFRYRLYKEVINAFYEMAEKLAASEIERKRLDKTREEWMTGISHDLRTPLSTIEGYGHLLESGQYSWTEEELQDMGKMIREKGDYMTDLLDDFNLAFQLKNHSLPHSFNPVNINELVRTIVLKFVNDKTLQEVAFSYESLEEEMFIMADPRWFERMIDNLIFNAIKHNPSGTKIAVSVKNTEDSICIMIEDTGDGMDKETILHLFDRYYRGTNTDESTEGAGLGMSIARAIVELHHGKITVESELNKGTTIELSFPVIA